MRQYAIDAVHAAVLDIWNTRPVAWRYVPSAVWKSYVYTDDPKLVAEARQYGMQPEALWAWPRTTAATRIDTEGLSESQLIACREIVSAPGAAFEVVRPHLTEAGEQALTTGLEHGLPVARRALDEAEERARFEAAMAREGYELNPVRYRDGVYKASYYESGWCMWRARAKETGGD